MTQVDGKGYEQQQCTIASCPCKVSNSLNLQAIMDSYRLVTRAASERLIAVRRCFWKFSDCPIGKLPISVLLVFIGKFVYYTSLLQRSRRRWQFYRRRWATFSSGDNIVAGHDKVTLLRYENSVLITNWCP